MALNFEVGTTLSINDRMSSTINGLGGKINNFATGAKAAFRSIVPEASRLNDVIKSVTIGNLVTKGIIAGVNVIRDNYSKAVNYASDLIETQNVVDTTFGSSAKAINDFAKSAGKNFGLTQLQAKKYASTIGSIFSGMGITGGGAVAMSKELTGLTGDLASFYNLDHDTAFNKIRAGITGETEPLKAIGIDMSENNLKNFMNTKGIKTAWKDLDAAGKAALRYQFIMHQTSKEAQGVQGDYAKPIDSYAVSTRNLANAIDEMRGNLAVGLMPALIKGADMLTGIVQKISTWAEKNKEIIASIFESFLTTTIGLAKILYGLLNNFGPAILGAVAAFKTFSTVSAVMKNVKTTLQGLAETTAVSGANAGAAANAFGTLTSAIGASHLAMTGLIGLAIWGGMKLWDMAKKTSSDLLTQRE
jgi:hypothetical protein